MAVLALTDGPRQRTIPSAAQGISRPCADIANPSKIDPNRTLAGGHGTTYKRLLEPMAELPSTDFRHR